MITAVATGSYVKMEAVLWTAISQAQLEGELEVASELIALLEGLDLPTMN